MAIDSHCHLERQTFGDEVDAVIARAAAAGVTHLVAVGASGGTAGAKEAIALAARHDNVFAVIGLHPHEAAKVGEGDLDELATLLAEPKVVGLGEIGLDYHYDFAPRPVQAARFRAQLELARARNLPVVIHTREAHRDTLALLDATGLPGRGGVVHCFTGTSAEAQEYLARGLHLSIPGVVTFKNAEALRDAVAAAPLERLLIETDTPYLAPVPFRGKRNEPALVLEVAAAVAKLCNLTAEDVARITAANAARLFGLPLAVAPALAYPIRDSLYLNVTSRCTLACTFCPKIERRDFWVRGHFLELSQDPPLDRVLAALWRELERRPEVSEVVFVGLGEATLRLDVVLAVGRALRERAGRRYRLRLDTDGLANLVHGRDVTAELATVVDAVSVSLNAGDGATYARWCRSKHGAAAYDAVKEFIRAAKASGMEVTASAVSLPGLDLDACRRVAVEELGVRFRARTHQQVG